ncbi:hypothetical protein GE061_019685 [Apolygus lucorum]|uniref:LisH domain-containing protein ARMC9 n=1 Tax=Apolygus lucorum TaxID=248454 RepID=A0A6A4JY72_APOLU|nr:hypothetical protein GE061_019685 [Apolygus lucorum]
MDSANKDAWSWMVTNLDSCYDVESTCVGMIFEFLDCHGFTKTIEAFRDETSSSGFVVNPDVSRFTKDRVRRDDALRLFGGLKSPDHTSFFKDWDEMIPAKVKTQTDYKKLTIYLYTYFSTHTFERDEDENVEMEAEPNLNDKYSSVMEFKSNERNVEEVATPQSLDQLTKLSGTFVLEKPFQENMPRIDDEPDGRQVDDEPSPKRERSESRDFEVDSLEDARERRNSDFTVILNDNDVAPVVDVTPVVDDNSAMHMFKKFLSDHGAEFASEPEFLPYFALPFVEHPKEHPTFTQVFEESWIENLRSNLAKFLVEHSCGFTAVPEIVNIYRENAISKNSQVKAAPDERKNFKELKRKMHKLKRDHQKLVGVANELASALEKSVQGEAVDLKTTLMKCASIFPELFPTHLPPHHKKWHSPDRHNLNEKTQIMSASNLDVKKIKQDLSEGSVKVQLLLLQALRWMLTKCNYNERDDVVSWFCKFDILGIRDGGIKEFLAPVATPHPIQQGIVRIMNALSSLNAGRKYLEGSESTINLLLDLTKQKELESVTEDMLIAVLQKLSIRKHWCEHFAKFGLIEWILGKLERLPQKIFTLEYSTSLLMNLVLSVEPERWDSNDVIANVLMNLMFSTHRQALEFVCGTLCCVLRNEYVNDYCRSQGLGPKLSTCLNNYKGDPLIEKQIETLIKIHRREIKPESFIACINTYSEEDMDDPEDLDPEIDELDPVTGSPNGNDLLRQQYFLVFNVPRIGRSPARLHTIPASPVALLPSWAQYS